MSKEQAAAPVKKANMGLHESQIATMNNLKNVESQINAVVEALKVGNPYNEKHLDKARDSFELGIMWAIKSISIYVDLDTYEIDKLKSAPWKDVVAKLNIKGITKFIAENCTVQSWENKDLVNVILLVIEDEANALINEAHIDRISKALEDLLKQKVTLGFLISEEGSRAEETINKEELARKIAEVIVEAQTAAPEVMGSPVTEPTSVDRDGNPIKVKKAKVNKVVNIKKGKKARSK